MILYELLTGAVPFEGETAVAIAFKQVSGRAAPAERAQPRACPPSLDAIVLRALAKDPAAALRRRRRVHRRAGARARARCPAVHRRARRRAAGGQAPPPRRTPPLRRPPAAAARAAPAARALEDGGRAARRGGRRAPAARADLVGAAAALLVPAAVALALVLLLAASKHVTVPNVAGQTNRPPAPRCARAGLDAGARRWRPARPSPSGLVISAGAAAGARSSTKGARVEHRRLERARAARRCRTSKGSRAAAGAAKLRAAGFKPTTKQQAELDGRARAR